MALLRVLAPLAGAFVALNLAVTVATTTGMTAAKALAARARTRRNLACPVCAGERTLPCATCRGLAAIEWSPFAQPLERRLCVCPTCAGLKKQRCLNCLGNGLL